MENEDTTFGGVSVSGWACPICHMWVTGGTHDCQSTDALLARLEKYKALYERERQRNDYLVTQIVGLISNIQTRVGRRLDITESIIRQEKLQEERELVSLVIALKHEFKTYFRLGKYGLHRWAHGPLYKRHPLAKALWELLRYFNLDD